MPAHILFFTPWYPDNRDPMLGLFVRKQALALSEIAKTGVIAVMPAEQRKIYNIEHNRYRNSLPEFRVYFRKSQFGFLNVIRTLIAYRKGLKQYISIYGNPDVIQANILTRTAIAAHRASRRLGVQFVIAEHWSRYLPENNSYKGFLRKMMTRLVAQWAKAIIVPSGHLEMAMKKAGISGSYVIVPNVIDEALFGFRSDEVRFQKKRIVHISCFEDQSKNISGLLRAASFLAKKRCDFELHLAGTGQDFGMMKSLCSQLKLEDTVIFHGLLENEKLADLLKSATCSVLPSHYETFGIVVYESLACGVPVVVTDVAGFGKIITPDLGIVVSTHNSEALADKLDRMLNTADNYDPVHLREFVLNSYTGRKVAEQLVNVYGF